MHGTRAPRPRSLQHAAARTLDCARHYRHRLLRGADRRLVGGFDGADGGCDAHAFRRCGVDHRGVSGVGWAPTSIGSGHVRLPTSGGACCTGERSDGAGDLGVDCRRGGAPPAEPGRSAGKNDADHRGDRPGGECAIGVGSAPAPQILDQRGGRVLARVSGYARLDRSNRGRHRGTDHGVCGGGRDRLPSDRGDGAAARLAAHAAFGERAARASPGGLRRQCDRARAAAGRGRC